MPNHITRAAPGLALAALLLASPARALVSDGYDPQRDSASVLNDSYSVVAADRLEAALKADRDYVTGMRQHHAGALTMSEESLADARSSSPLLRELARAIIQNQQYEIAVLDEVARKLGEPPRILDLGFARLAIQPSATENLAQRHRVFRYPVPTPLTPASTPDHPVTVRDVQFAKGMIIHHQGALEMAEGYQSNPDGRNTFLGLLNVDIITDQTQEIALMRRAVGAFAGDANAVEVPPGMVHGMEGMSHGTHPAGGAAPVDPHAGHGRAPVDPPAGTQRQAPGGSGAPATGTRPGHRGH